MVSRARELDKWVAIKKLAEEKGIWKRTSEAGGNIEVIWDN